MISKDSDGYNSCRPAPTLGMRQGATFVVKPLHDPGGEFAIVLYDPTVDDKPEPKEVGEEPSEAEKVELDQPLVHKSLADILGLKKKVDERPKVPVVIDPTLAKVLRPHQVEGVKVSHSDYSSVSPYANLLLSFFSDVQPVLLTGKQMAASWQMRWV